MAFVSIMTIVALDIMFIPWWTFLVALATGALIVVPLGWLYAISNFQLPIGTFNELLYGTMVQNLTHNRSPIGASVSLSTSMIVFFLQARLLTYR